MIEDELIVTGTKNEDGSHQEDADIGVPRTEDDDDIIIIMVMRVRKSLVEISLWQTRLQHELES